MADRNAFAHLLVPVSPLTGTTVSDDEADDHHALQRYRAPWPGFERGDERTSSLTVPSPYFPDPPGEETETEPEMDRQSVGPDEAAEEHVTDTGENGGIGQFNLQLLQSLRNKKDEIQSSFEGHQAAAGQKFEELNVFANPPTSNEIVDLFEESSRRREQHQRDVKRGEYYLKSDAPRLSFRSLRAKRRSQMGLAPSTTTSPTDCPSPSPSSAKQGSDLELEPLESSGPSGLPTDQKTAPFADVDVLTPRNARFDHHHFKGDPSAPVFPNEILELGIDQYQGEHKLEFMNQYSAMVNRRKEKGKGRAVEPVKARTSDEGVPPVIRWWFSNLPVEPDNPQEQSPMIPAVPPSSPFDGIKPSKPLPAIPPAYRPSTPHPSPPKLPLHSSPVRGSNTPEVLKSAFRATAGPCLFRRGRANSSTSPARATVRFAPLPPPAESPPSSPSPPASFLRSPRKQGRSGRAVPTVYAWIYDSPVRFGGERSPNRNRLTDPESNDDGIKSIDGTGFGRRVEPSAHDAIGASDGNVSDDESSKNHHFHPSVERVKVTPDRHLKTSGTSHNSKAPSSQQSAECSPTKKSKGHRNTPINSESRTVWPATTASPITLNRPTTPGARKRTHPNPLRSHMITDEGRDEIFEMVARLDVEKRDLDERTKQAEARAGVTHRQALREVSPGGYLAENELTPSPTVTPQTSGDLGKDGKGGNGKEKGCRLANKVVAVGKGKVVLIKKARGVGKVGFKGGEE